MTQGLRLLLAFLNDRCGGTAVGLHNALVAAARKDPLARPEDVPALRRVYLWLDGLATPNRSNRRLIAIASGGRVRKDNSVGGSPSVPEGAWRERG